MHWTDVQDGRMVEGGGQVDHTAGLRLAEETVMIVFKRVGTAMPGKNAEAHAYVRNRSKFLKKAYGLDTEVSVQMGGKVGRIALASRHKSLADLEKLRKKIMADPKSAKNQAGADGLFVPGETEDSIWLIS